MAFRWATPSFPVTTSRDESGVFLLRSPSERAPDPTTTRSASPHEHSGGLAGQPWFARFTFRPRRAAISARVFDGRARAGRAMAGTLWSGALRNSALPSQTVRGSLSIHLAARRFAIGRHQRAGADGVAPAREHAGGTRHALPETVHRKRDCKACGPGGGRTFPHSVVSALRHVKLRDGGGSGETRGPPAGTARGFASEATLLQRARIHRGLGCQRVGPSRSGLRPFAFQFSRTTGAAS